MTFTRPRPSSRRRIAVIGAGIAGLAAARTLLRAGHDVQVFESASVPGGRLATQDSPFGGFDSGAQYFTVRDPRFAQALEVTAADIVRRWSANAVRVLDELGRVVEAALPAHEAHWVAVPAMAHLPARWAEPLAAAGALHLATRVTRIAPDALAPAHWQLHTEGAEPQAVHAGFDAVLLATPASSARELLLKSEQLKKIAKPLSVVDVAPCWTLMLAYPNAAQPGLQTLGPQWSAARSTHHRVAWLARESSKPAREQIERWTVQASAAWSREHENDGATRVTAKLLKAFAEVAGIRATPAFAEALLWPQAQTLVPLGQPYVWDSARGIGVCGDWCIGHRVEDAFVSGLELALAVER
ncbi:NAD(P)/FAD-dependent oxidoreductase [Ottowia testudinis]|uniref:FAD-dependent oxidoreductase n=1 Tax=Ottowia testudinis TaxID=2816950 RepID=A0A975CK59_9BURK|nr:FAD-dependent oxidoreductase [Ottowia testudinis]QTD46477.1 FAD-dependent oxidoreductase [Ottowia testudinis]